MMKKYNKPEIVTLALDVVDVIETSGLTAQEIAANQLNTALGGDAKVKAIETQVTQMADTWSW